MKIGLPVRIVRNCSLGFGAAILFSIGCGKARLDTAPVSGKVTIDGKPVTTGRVLFIPDRGRTAKGELQSDGSFSLTTYSEGDGAIVGKHRVSIEARTIVPRKNIESEEPPGKSLIPEYYSDDAKSGLTFDVKSGQDNMATFELRSR